MIAQPNWLGIFFINSNGLDGYLYMNHMDQLLKLYYDNKKIKSKY